ncbi:MAG TPA: GNAT family N-acetyltransferase [Asanoa sp.]
MTDAAIRSYRPSDHAAARELWVELVSEHQSLYGSSTGSGSGSADPGAAFEEYLTRLDLSGLWVADSPAAGVVGMVGLIMSGRIGEVYPVVVAAAHRRQGVGRALLDHVAGQARRRSLSRLTINPESRNLSALRALHAAGYDVLTAVELSMELRPGSSDSPAEVDLMGLRFRS